MQSSVLFVTLLALIGSSVAQPGGGFNCTSVSSPFCLNGGTCANSFITSPSSASCTCLPGFVGAHCEIIQVNDCNGNVAPSAWVGDGICNNGNSFYGTFYINFNCALWNYDGGDCGTSPVANTHLACASNPCGTGTCFGNNTGYWCSCPRNTAGANCQITVNGCNPSPCLNGGRCISDIGQPNNYICVCPSTVYGVNCQTPIPSGGGVTPATCASGCPFGGYCYATNLCSCPYGYVGGSTCTLNTACNSNPCQNGGTCNYPLNSASYQCLCASGYSGLSCQTATPSCFPNPCQNSGFCSTNTNPGPPYSCTCAGHSGLNCSFAPNTFDCAGNAFYKNWATDGSCENRNTYLQPSTASEARYVMVDCVFNIYPQTVPQGLGQPACPSEISSAVSMTSSLTAVILALLVVLTAWST